MFLPDLLNEPNARALAIRIESYWHARGHTVSAWTERMQPVDTAGMKMGGHACFVVRSDLVNGLPVTAPVALAE